MACVSHSDLTYSFLLPSGLFANCFTKLAPWPPIKMFGGGGDYLSPYSSSRISQATEHESGSFLLEVINQASIGCLEDTVVNKEHESSPLMEFIF